MEPSPKNARFAICLENTGQDDLLVGKVYQILPDAAAEEVACLRVIDESGDDYLYPASRFSLIELPQEAQSRLFAAVRP